MDPSLISICKDFEQLQGFLHHHNPEQIATVHTLFEDFMKCFIELKEEKLNYPKEFQEDVKLYHQGFEPIIQKFEDVEIRYLMLSDFYDFARIKKLYTPNK